MFRLARGGACGQRGARIARSTPRVRDLGRALRPRPRRWLLLRPAGRALSDSGPSVPVPPVGIRPTWLGRLVPEELATFQQGAILPGESLLPAAPGYTPFPDRPIGMSVRFCTVSATRAPARRSRDGSSCIRCNSRALTADKRPSVSGSHAGVRRFRRGRRAAAVTRFRGVGSREVAVMLLVQAESLIAQLAVVRDAT